MMMMDQILAQAIPVVSWIGNIDGPSFKLAATHLWACSGTVQHDIGLPVGLFQRTGSDDVTVVHDIEQQINAYKELLGSFYWSKTWTVQEYVLEQDVSLQCGESQLPLDSGNPREMLYAANLVTARKSIVNLYQHRVSFKSRTRESRLDFDLGTCLIRYATLRCADPRDKVFALLGLCRTEYQTLIEVNYSKSGGDTFLETTFGIQRVEGPRSRSFRLAAFLYDQVSINAAALIAHRFSAAVWKDSRFKTMSIDIGRCKKGRILARN